MEEVTSHENETGMSLGRRWFCFLLLTWNFKTQRLLGHMFATVHTVEKWGGGEEETF